MTYQWLPTAPTPPVGHVAFPRRRPGGIAREIGDPRGEGIVLGNLGTYADLGETRRAIAVRGEALVLFELVESLRVTQARAMIERFEQESGRVGSASGC
jgi:hypothetical protein